MKLYDYDRSSAAFRVRIALNLKNLSYEKIPVHLLKEEQADPAYKKINPQGLVPVLIETKKDNPHLVQEFALSQSLAIIEYLEDQYPDPPLLPKTAKEKAEVRALSLLIACDIHPLNNLRVLRYLKHVLNVNDEQKEAWYQNWVLEGLQAFETRLGESAGLYCFGDTPTMADVCLIPQVYNAKRFNCPIDTFTKILRIYDQCQKNLAFQNAFPLEETVKT